MLTEMEIDPLDSGLSVVVYVDCYKKWYKKEWRYLLGHSWKLNSYTTYKKSLSMAPGSLLWNDSDQVTACISQP